VLVAVLITRQPLERTVHHRLDPGRRGHSEAMPAVSTITLSRGMRIMAEHKPLTRACGGQTLGSTSVSAPTKPALTENR
jgi:Ca2+-transporting ATPase